MAKSKRIALICLVILLCFMAWGWFNIWRSPAYYTPQADCRQNSSIISMEAYGSLIDAHDRPYIVTKKDIVLFGAEHTRDPEDAQLASIRSTWDSLKPTVALVEGRVGFFMPYVMNSVVEYGEIGFVVELAKKDGADIFSWELPKSDLILRLLETYSPDQVALQQILSPYFSNLRFGKPENPEQFVGQYLNRAGYPGLDNVISSVADIDRVWNRDFADYPDWRETSDQYGLPGYLAEMGSAANMIRNQHLLCAINELHAKGERVFVICGLSHAVCLEPAL